MYNTENKQKGRFAPSPTGRMHLGNVFSALLSMADDVRRRLLSPTMHEIMKCSIAETARPAVVEKLRPKLRNDAYPKKRPDAWAR